MEVAGINPKVVTTVTCSEEKCPFYKTDSYEYWCTYTKPWAQLQGEETCAPYLKLHGLKAFKE